MAHLAGAGAGAGRKIASRQAEHYNDGIQEAPKAGKMKVRYQESRQVRDMRENYEKADKRAMRSSRAYREIAKAKKEKGREIENMANKGHGECYVDKSRGIAMSSGAMDVKETMAEYEDQIAMTGKLSGGDLLNLHILIEQAAYELRQHKPEQALSYLKAGLRKDKACIEMLELKGKCYIDMNLYREALDAADEILIGLRENTNSTALAVKASALYNLGDFEHALMSFHRALRTSSIRDRLTLLEGIKSTELGVMNAVGSRTVQYFRNLDEIIHLMPVNIMGMSWYHLKNEMNDNETKKRIKKKDKKFLEALAADKQYLEGIIKKISSPKNKSISMDMNKHLVTQSIISEAQNALGFLQDRREFWSQQKPVHESGQKSKESSESKPKWNVVQSRVVSKQKTFIFGH